MLLFCCSDTGHYPLCELHLMYCHVTECDYKLVLDWSDLLDSLTHNSWLHFTNHCQTQTTVLILLVSTNRCLVATSTGGRSPSSEFPNCSRPHLSASHSNSSQRLNCSSLTNSPTSSSLTHTLTHSLILLITSPHGPHRKHRYSAAVKLLRYLLGCLHDRDSPIAYQRPWFGEQLFSNGCCIVAYFPVVA
jgi:hypothetical protein